MKTSVVTTLIENIARVQEFIPERVMLIERTVAAILKNLEKQSKALRRYTKSEQALAASVGVDAVVSELLFADPKTKELLTRVGEAVVDYYEHVDILQKAGEVEGEAN